MVGWFYESVKIGLLSHGNGDGRGRRKDEFGNNVSRDKAGCALVQLIAQSPF
jgi:hypothetical protein